MEFELIRSASRTLSLELTRDGRLLVRAPQRLPMAAIRHFVDSQADWIERQRQKQAARPQVPPLTEKALAALKKRARPVLCERAEALAERVGVGYGRVSVRSQHSKWGSCSAAGNLNFNCLLLLAPPEVLDYVVVHELCHRLEMNHSPRFWAEVERVLPDYRAARQWLRQNGASLMALLPEKGAGSEK